MTVHADDAFPTADSQRFLDFDFWHSTENCLRLNPRLVDSTRAIYEKAWSELVVGKLCSIVGIATSGSSGELGRLILLRKEALLTSAQAANERLGAGPRDSWLRTLPTFHVGGLQIGARALLSNSKVIESSLVNWDPSAFYLELVASRATLLSLVPTQLFDLVQLQLSSPPPLRAVIVGGGRLEPALQRAARALGWPALPSYGLTECGSQVATAHPPGDDTRLWPLAHVEIRTPQSLIEIRSRGLLFAQICFQNGEAIYEDPKRGNWFTSEDRGQIEGDGSLTILGRAQDFIKIGGEGVLLSRLQEILERLKLEQNYRNDAALLAANDDRLGAKLVLIVTDDGEGTGQLRRAFDAAVMPFEKVREMHVVAKIPRSALGKLLRLETLSLVGLKPMVDMGRN